MIKHWMIGAGLGIGILVTSAQSQTYESEFRDDYKAAANLQYALKHNDRVKVAALIGYPLGRDKPLPPITSESEFLVHWDEYFDADMIKRLTQQKPEEIGWRGVMLADGCMWFNKGKVLVINCKTAAYDKMWSAAKELDWKRLYKTAQGYDRIDFECDTDTLHIRTQYHGKDLRYFAWRKGEDMASRPQLELRAGDNEPQGNGGNYNLVFKNLPYTYTLEITHICGDDCNSYVVVARDDREISRRVCKAN